MGGKRHVSFLDIQVVMSVNAHNPQAHMSGSKAATQLPTISNVGNVFSSRGRFPQVNCRTQREDERKNETT